MIVYFLAVLCTEYFIKPQKGDLYLQGIKGLSVAPYFGPKETANLFRFETAPDHVLRKNIFIHEAPDQVLDLSEIANKIVYYRYSNSPNQQAVLKMEDGSKLFRIEMLNKCLTWHPQLGFLDAQPCAQDNFNQRFKIECANCVRNSVKKKDSLLGFYDERVMSTLGKIRAMAQDVVVCFENNGTCSRRPGSSQLCLSRFDTPLGFANGLDYNSEDGLGLGSGTQTENNDEDENGENGDGSEDKNIHVSFDSHDENLRHEEKQQRLMEHEFNARSQELEDKMKELYESAFNFADTSEKQKSFSEGILNDIQKLRQDPTYADLFKKSSDAAEVQRRVNEQKEAAQIHEQAEEFFDSLAQKMHEHSLLEKHAEENHAREQMAEVQALSNKASDKYSEEEYHKDEENYAQNHGLQAATESTESTIVEPISSTEDNEPQPKNDRMINKIKDSISALQSKLATLTSSSAHSSHEAAAMVSKHAQSSSSAHASSSFSAEQLSQASSIKQSRLTSKASASHSQSRLKSSAIQQQAINIVN